MCIELYHTLSACV